MILQKSIKKYKVLGKKYYVKKRKGCTNQNSRSFQMATMENKGIIISVIVIITQT